MSDACDRWIRIADAEAVGEAIPEADRSFLRDHAASCEACGAEASAYAGLAALAGRAPAPEDASVDAVLAQLQAVPMGGPSPPQTPQAAIATVTAIGWRRTGRRAATVAVVAFAAAAALALVWRRSGAPRGEDRTAATVASPGLVVGGQAKAPGSPVAFGSLVEAGEAPGCLRIEPGIRACLARGTRARFTESSATRRTLRLEEGSIGASLEHQPAGSSFSIAFEGGQAVAVGTEFTVAQHAGEAAAVHVLDGVVAVTSQTPAQRVEVHQALTVGSPLRTLTAEEEAHDRALLSGEAPPPLLAPTAEPAPTASADETARAADPPRPPPSAAPPRSPAEMLQDARELRAGGRFREAALAYQRLQAAHPRSAEARAVLVSLGDLQLSHLGDAAGALRSYDAYLAGGGGLRQEALNGRIRALRALGRSGDERAAIESFLAAYPSSMAAAALSARLDALRGR